MNLLKKYCAGLVSAIMLSLSLGAEARPHNNTQDFSSYEMEADFAEGEADLASSAEIEALSTKEALADGFIFEDSDGDCQFLSIETKQISNCDTQQKDLLYDSHERLYEEIQIAGLGDWICSPKEYLTLKREDILWGFVRKIFPDQDPEEEITENGKRQPNPTIRVLNFMEDNYDSPAEWASIAPAYAFGSLTMGVLINLGMRGTQHVVNRAFLFMGGAFIGTAGLIAGAGTLFIVATLSCGPHNTG